jgi:hemerythrin superfamily protein
MTDQRPETMPATDVVDLLIHQHALIRDLFVEVAAATGQRRRELFEQLVRLLAVHETAEEEVVHPLARQLVPDGAAVVDDRLREEHDAKQVLEQLDGMDPDAPEFLPALDQLRHEVLAHATSEERYEFYRLREKASPSQLKAMERAVKAAEAMAPTHPHAGVESATANVLMGTPIAMMDRVRDAIQRVTGKPTSPR